LKDWDDEIFNALAHPIRRQVIEFLREKKSLSYSELLELINITNHGKLGFHIRTLKGLVDREPSTNKYRLTERGYLASELVWDIRFVLSRGQRDLASEPTRYVQKLGFGDHAFLLYSTEYDKREVAFSFLEAGLLKEEAVIFLVPEQRLDSENREVQRYGISANNFREGAFTVMSAEEWYLKKGKAHAKTIIASMLELLKAKQKAGFKGLRGAGEMEVFFNHGKNEQLLKYEAMLGRQFTQNLCALCIYDVNMLDERQISQLTNCHGHMVSKDMAWKVV
jgi:DNA-binding transcriptional ArsR family regulator